MILEKSRVKLTICGSDYVLISEDSESYMRLVGEKVDKKLSEILEKCPKFSVSMAAVLSSLEFCDEKLKSQEKFEQLKSQVENYVNENTQIQIKCKKMENENLSLKSEISDLKLKIEDCKSEIERCKADKSVSFVAPECDIVTFSTLKNEVASDC